MWNLKWKKYLLINKNIKQNVMIFIRNYKISIIKYYFTYLFVIFYNIKINIFNIYNCLYHNEIYIIYLYIEK